MSARVQRVVSGVAAAACLGLILYLRGWVLELSVLAVMGIAIWELQAALRAAGAKASPVFGLVYALLLYPAWLALGYLGVFAWFLLCCVASMSGVLWGEISLANLLGAVLWPIYPALPFTAIYLLVMEVRDERLLVFLLLLCFVPAFLTDIFAYQIGGWIGKRRLSPISPNKTIEGAIGGFIGGLTGSVGIGILAYFFGNTAIYWWEFILLGAVCGIVDQLGDLWASLIKRACGIKDFGRIMPGHGGILDRLDGVLFCSVVVLAWMIIRSVIL